MEKPTIFLVVTCESVPNTYFMLLALTFDILSLMSIIFLLLILGQISIEVLVRHLLSGTL